MKKQSLTLFHVSALTGEGKHILNDVSVTFVPGKIHVIMGPNGSGKSTLANVILGHPGYVAQGRMLLGKKDIIHMETSKRAQLGLFLAFQSPVAVPGVTVKNIIRASFQERAARGKRIRTHSSKVLGSGLANGDFQKTMDEIVALLHIEPNLLERSIHDGFSGGEKKKIEVLQALMLQPEYAIFDEIDTGLDVDALKIVAAGIRKLQKSGTGCILITHYQRLLRYLPADTVTVIKKGAIVHTGGANIVGYIEKHGYE